MTDPLSAAVAAHRAALAAQEAMRVKAHERDEAVQAARAAGVPAVELANSLGVNRQRIHAMLKKEASA
jgi:crotonobetainyl-CoA:carnitine CoA-transferase CaiB-like acyl-CoA transferase